MEVTQIYEHVNIALKESTGLTNVLLEDLSNIVSIGDEVFKANAVDKYVDALVNRIGKVIFVARKYKGVMPKVLMDKWDFGSVVEKIRMDLVEAQPNESWELRHGASYDPNIFYQPKVSVKFWNDKKTFEIPISITYEQVKMSFTSAQELNSFVDMIFVCMENSMTVYMDNLIRNTINNLISITIKNAYGSTNIKTTSKPNAVNLLYLYNETLETSNKLTVAQAMRSPDFLRFATEKIRLTLNRMREMSTLFNVGKTKKFTPKDLQHVVLLSDFASAQYAYLQSDTYHKEMISLPNYEEISFWQGSGEDYSFSSTSSINIIDSQKHTTNMSGIIGVAFDRDALGVTNLDRRTPGGWNPKAEFYNYYYKYDAGFFNDPNENFVVFFLA